LSGIHGAPWRGRWLGGVFVKGVCGAVEAAIDVFLAGGEALGEELARNGRLCGGRLHAKSIRVLGDLEARLCRGLLQVVLQALFRGAGLAGVSSEDIGERLPAVSIRGGTMSAHPHLTGLGGLLAGGARRLAAQFAGCLKHLEVMSIQ
jgi:hypothetical protein